MLNWVLPNGLKSCKANQVCGVFFGTSAFVCALGMKDYIE